MLTSEGSCSCATKLSVSSTKESSMICTPNWTTDWLEGNKVMSSTVGRRNRPKSSPAVARRKEGKREEKERREGKGREGVEKAKEGREEKRGTGREVKRGRDEEGKGRGRM